MKLKVLLHFKSFISKDFVFEKCSLHPDYEKRQRKILSSWSYCALNKNKKKKPRFQNRLLGIKMRRLETLAFPLISLLLTFRPSLVVKVNKVHRILILENLKKTYVLFKIIFQCLQKGYKEF